MGLRLYPICIRVLYRVTYVAYKEASSLYVVLEENFGLTPRFDWEFILFGFAIELDYLTCIECPTYLFEENQIGRSSKKNRFRKFNFLLKGVTELNERMLYIEFPTYPLV